MVDLAELGFRFETQKITAANRELAVLEQRAKGAGMAADGLTSRTGRVTTAHRAAASAAAAQAAATTRLAGSAGVAAASMTRMLGPLAAFGSFAGLQGMLDTTIRIQNSLRVAGLEGAELSGVYDTLYRSAQRNAAPLESLVKLYGKASLVQDELGASTEDMLEFTDKIAVALRVSGQSATEASGALMQLSQALGAGTVRAEEFNSIAEGALPILSAAAAGIEEAGGSVSRLKTLVNEGAVSSQAFFRGFEEGSKILTQKVATSTFTLSQGFTRLNNTMVNSVGTLNEIGGVGEILGGELVGVARSVEDVTDSLDDLARLVPGGASKWIDWADDLLFALDPLSRSIWAINAGLQQLSDMSTGDGRMTGADFRDTFKMYDRSPSAGGGLEAALAAYVARVNPVTPISLEEFGASSGPTAAQIAAATATARLRLSTGGRSASMFDTAFGTTAGGGSGGGIGEQINLLPDGFGRASSALDGFNARFERTNELAQGFVSDLRRGLQDGQSLFGALGDAALSTFEQIAEAAIREGIANIVMMLIGGFTGGGFGGGGGGFAQGLQGGMGVFMGGLYEKGGAFHRGTQLTAFAHGGIVDRPTIFPMARGAGLMGEAGPEAVMPLRRGPDGRLGVSAGGGEGSSVTNEDNRTTVVIHVHGVTDARSFQKAEGQITRSMNRALDKSRRRGS